MQNDDFRSFVARASAVKPVTSRNDQSHESERGGAGKADGKRQKKKPGRKRCVVVLPALCDIPNVTPTPDVLLVFLLSVLCLQPPKGRRRHCGRDGKEVRDAALRLAFLPRGPQRKINCFPCVTCG